MTITPNSVSDEKLIREMDATELLEYANRLNTLLASNTAPTGTSELLALARIQYKQITNIPMTLATISRK